MSVANNLLQDSLQNLLDKLQLIQMKTEIKMGDASKIEESLDKLSRVVENLELQHSQENKLVSKLETLASQLERLSSLTVKKGQRKMRLEHSFRNFIAGTKKTGQVMETIASSLEAVLDSITQAITDFRTISSTLAKS